jgi:ureidoacrylate peracid hydrolase
VTQHYYSLIRYRPGDYETWKYIAPTQKVAWSHKAFENGTRSGEIRREFELRPGDIVALEHWCSSGFANTDLDLLLKTHGIHKLIVIGLIATTSVEDEKMRAALDLNIPNYASAIVITDEVVEPLSFHVRLTQSLFRFHPGIRAGQLN